MSAASVIGGGAQALPLHVALSVIPSLPRPMLARFVTRAIEQLDAMDGDPDLEDDDPAEDADSDYCLAEEDHGTPYALSRKERAAIRELRRQLG